MTATHQPLPTHDERESLNKRPCPGEVNEIAPARALPKSCGATGATRHCLPDERWGVTHHFSVAGQEGYVTVSIYEDGSPGELFIRMAKEGSTISGLMDALATAVSLALQYGVPLEAMCRKFTHMRFEPSGWSDNPQIGYAKSLVDYIFRWLEMKFLKRQQGELFELPPVVPQANGSERRCDPSPR